MPSFAPHLDGFLDVANQMHADLARRARAHFELRRLEKASLATIADFEAYRTRVRAHFIGAIGGLPSEKSELNARITGVVPQNGFRIEKLLFESLPGYLVSAACYVPEGLTEPAPAVLFFCGHAQDGKAHGAYQQVCRDLASNGFIVLAVDPIGQGERQQFWQEGKPWLDVCTIEHTHAGLPFFVQGTSVARHFVWDAIRAFDYLASRDDVDAARIGATGNSGGGTQVCYLTLCEPRLAAAVPCTFPTTLEALFKSGNVQDLEQIVPGCFVHGPDHDDFLTALAPRPVLLGAVAYDQFPIEGSHEASARAKRIYELYGRPENSAIAVDNARHCYSDGLREACVNWFKAHLKNEAPIFKTAGPEVLPPEALHATASGHILLDFPDSTTITDLARAHIAALPSPSTCPETLRHQLDERLGVSRSGSRAAPIFPRLMEPDIGAKAITEKIWFFSAPDIAVAGVLHHPRNQPDEVTAAVPVTVLMRPDGASVDSEELVASLLNQGRRVFVFDVRGTGAVSTRSLSSIEGVSSYAPPFDTEYKLACDAAMLGLSTAGLRAFDVLRAFDYLTSREDISEVALHGIGPAAFWAFFAAALEPRFAAVTCEDMLLSFRALCADAFYDSRRWAFPAMPFGLLCHGDLEDFARCIAPRPLHLITPRDPRGEIVSAPGRIHFETAAPAPTVV